MKKRLSGLSFLMAALLVLLAGCGKDELDEELLIGRWYSTEGYYYNFHSDHTGESYDDEGSLDFTWSLSSDELELRFTGHGQAGKAAYLTFVIDKLTDSRMEAYDKNDPSEKTIYFTKK